MLCFVGRDPDWRHEIIPSPILGHVLGQTTAVEKRVSCRNGSDKDTYFLSIEGFGLGSFGGG